MSHSSTQKRLTESTRTDTSTTNKVSGEDNKLVLVYRNDKGNAVAARVYVNHGEFVREVEREWMYNYVDERWESTQRFVHDYELCDDGKTLAGDGSNWRGTNKNWRDWFRNRFCELLRIRFQNESDAITEDIYREDYEIPSEIQDQIGDEREKQIL